MANVRFALWPGGNGIFTSFPGGGERFIGVRALPNIRQLGEADVRIEAQTKGDSEICAVYLNLGDGGNPAFPPSQAYITNNICISKSTGLEERTVKLLGTLTVYYSDSVKTTACWPVWLAACFVNASLQEQRHTNQ